MLIAHLLAVGTLLESALLRCRKIGCSALGIVACQTTRACSLKATDSLVASS
jgi:hypothetical protein